MPLLQSALAVVLPQAVDSPLELVEALIKGQVLVARVLIRVLILLFCIEIVHHLQRVDLQLPQDVKVVELIQFFGREKAIEESAGKVLMLLFDGFS